MMTADGVESFCRLPNCPAPLVPPIPEVPMESIGCDDGAQAPGAFRTRLATHQRSPPRQQDDRPLVTPGAR